LTNKDEINKLLEESITELIGGEEGLNEETIKLIKKHETKTHFIPIKYRVLGGFLQSLNIKFGIFIEILLPKLIAIRKGNFDVVKEVSGRKDIRLSLEESCEREIDNYINHPPTKEKLLERFDELRDIIFINQNKKDGLFKTETFDVDLLLKDKEGKYFYIETKYNDDHDTGKFKDINRKFLKTFAGLVNKFQIKEKNNFIPIIYYFNENVRYKDIYLKEDIQVLRGRQLFNKLKLGITFTEIDKMLFTISENLEKEFDEFREKIFAKVKGIKQQKKLS